MSKILLYIGGIISAILALMFVADYFLNIPLLRSMPGVGQIACQFPTTVSGSSMEPTIKTGSRVTFNKCIGNKESLSIGTVVLFSGEQGNSISRIKDKIPEQDKIIYKVSQDNRPDAVFEVRPDRIIGILQP
ncbi:S26 family signal peptidase [Candidatus Daviesbacteria bacterium]|nr:S26 family signal peptidase [Candidatus Daviesbacteria bacterium]